MSAYMKHQFAFLGVKSTPRRQAVRSILARRPLDWPLIWDCWAAEEREYQYVACDHLLRHKFPAAQLESLRELIVTKSWWDTVDNLAKVAGTTLPEGNAVLREWATDDNMWVRRAAIICQVTRPADTDLLTFAIEHNLPDDSEHSPYGDEFFIRKAIGWALRDHARRDPEWVRGFVHNHELAPLSQREALKHLS